TPNLTLNLGLRYEFQPNPENQLAFPGYNPTVGPFGTLTTPVKIKEDGNNFAPRVGISYTPRFWQSIFGHDKTVFRAGSGIFYAPLYTNILDNAAGSSPNAVAAPINGGAGRGLANATASFGAFNPVLNPLSTQTTLASNMVNPLVHQWNANIQRELPW